MSGRAGDAGPAGQSGQLLDPRRRGIVEETQLKMIADWHRFDRAGRRPPRGASDADPKLAARDPRPAPPRFKGRERIDCRRRVDRAFTLELVDAGTQKAQLRVPAGDGAQHVRGYRPADVHCDRLAAQPEELRRQGQERELRPDLGRDVVAQAITARKPERNHQCVRWRAMRMKASDQRLSEIVPDNFN
jgi:hypothetical protein